MPKICDYPHCISLEGGVLIFCVCNKITKNICFSHIGIGLVCQECFISMKNNRYNYINHEKYIGNRITILQITMDTYVVHSVVRDAVDNIVFGGWCVGNRVLSGDFFVETRIKNANDLQQYTYSPLLIEMYTISNNYVHTLPKDIIGIIDNFLFNEYMFLPN